MSIFSNRLLALREENNLSKTAVAKKLGLSVQRYANWEYGTREPDLENLKAISKLYGVSTDYLTGKDNDKDKKSVEISSIIYKRICAAVELAQKGELSKAVLQ